MGVKTVKEYEALTRALIKLINVYGPFIAISVIRTLDLKNDITTIIRDLE